MFAVLRDRTVKKLGQNLDFECRFLGHHYGFVPEGLHDTQVAELALRAGLWPEGKWGDKELDADGGAGGSRAPYVATSMARLCLRYLGLLIDKDRALRTSFDTTPPGKHTWEQLQYAGLDTIYPYFIAVAQRPEIQQRKLQHTIAVEYETIPLLAETALAGFGIDEHQWTELYQEAMTKREDARRGLDSLFQVAMGQGELWPQTAAGQRPIFPRTKRGLNYDAHATGKLHSRSCAGVLLSATYWCSSRHQTAPVRGGHHANDLAAHHA